MLYEDSYVTHDWSKVDLASESNREIANMFLDDNNNFHIRCYLIYWLVLNFTFVNLLDEIGESDVGRVSEHFRNERESL